MAPNPKSYIWHFTWDFLSTLPQKSLATLDGKIVDPEIAVELKMRDVLKVHDAQTKHIGLHHLIHQM